MGSNLMPPDTEDAFLEANKRDNTEGPWRPQHPNGGSTGTAQDYQGIFNMTTRGHKPLHYSCKMHHHTTMRYEAG